MTATLTLAPLCLLPRASFGDVLSSPAWSVGATVLAAVAIIVAVLLARQQRSIKALGYEVQLTELVSVHRGVRDRIRIFFGDDEVKQAHLLRLRLQNTGNVPILESDFANPLTLVFGSDGRPLTVEASSRPGDIVPACELDGSRVRLEPLLLNPGDQVELEVFVSDFDSFDLDYRIVGISRLAAISPQPTLSIAELFAASLRPLAQGFGIPFQDLLRAARRATRR